MIPRKHPDVKAPDLTKSAVNAAALQQHFSKMLSLGANPAANPARSRKPVNGPFKNSKHPSGPSAPGPASGLAPGPERGSERGPAAAEGFEESGDNPKLTLAQRLGLVSAPAAKLTSDEWRHVETIAASRGEAKNECSICFQKFGLADQVILSCSHMFHAACLASYERFVKKTKRKSCPLCRAKDYQKRRTEQGKAEFVKESAVLIQAVWRGHQARKQALRLRCAKDPLLKRKVLSEKLARISSRMEARSNRQQRRVDDFIADIDRSVSSSRISSFSEMDWRLSEQVAKQRCLGNEHGGSLSMQPIAAECPICMTAMGLDARPVVLTSCSHVFHEACLSSFESFQSSSFPTPTPTPASASASASASALYNPTHCHSCPVCRSAYLRRLLSMASWGKA
eukprot:ANDGO_08363.mRNA.1 hypothetical protein H257_03740